ncbi:hypothetical protein K503DRAFT_768973 [Rhizopogon vinicolor AM-OR11-026]|uniref:Uncharacterized protein n=1 Tax=Rhizopogon vinicolor AM-OR11-026 TaxID=1314800 RepID=A0A1B7N5A2_9AGAM|nr:hypothetical protein K503DRAFT_768973 [Rhizopogon vinicolor AM-OR11-026]
MNFTNINDPAGIQALLEQLRSSQAWQESISTSAADQDVSEPENPPSTSTTPQAASTPVQPSAPTSDISNASSSVADLLSQLKPSQWITPSRTPQPPAPYFTAPQTSSRSSHLESHSTPQPPETSARQQSLNVGERASTRGLDLRMMSFQQTLPHLTELAENVDFVSAISRLREEQKGLEKQLWEERLAVHKKHENKVKVALTKAGLIGGGISQHEADMMNNAFRKELQKFDAERVLFAWDGLLEKQQSSLEALGVPTMFPTDLRAHREKQQRVVQVLEGIVG